MSKESTDFKVVGIGASAGGIQALKPFFESLPENTEMAFVVIVHLLPDHESHLADLLQKSTMMPVTQVTDPVRLEPDQVYVVSPNHTLTIQDGVLQAATKLSETRQAVIDIFFRSLAEEYGESAVAVILSGTGNDGTAGLSQVKERGGFTIVQLPDEAEHDAMPRGAIASGHVDLILSVKEMGERIQLFNSNDMLGEADGISDEGEEILLKILDLVRAESGQSFSRYKRATILRRISRRIQLSGKKNLSSYYEYIRDKPEEIEKLYNDFLLTVTKFFRDPDTFEMLNKDVVPRLIQSSETVRVWSCGCATGEEAYSIAMLLAEQRDHLKATNDIQIFASDISGDALKTAREGFYPKGIANDVSKERLNRFFTESPNGYRVKKHLREKIVFSLHNVLNDPPFAKLDLIICRNVLIYLDHESQKKLFDLFHYALNDEGYLFLGTSEAAGSDLFQPINKFEHIYRKKDKVGRNTFPALSYERINNQDEPGMQLTKRAAVIRNIEEVHQKFILPHTPAGIIVSSDYEVLHSLGGGEKYLTFAAGRPTQNLFKVVRKELRLELRTSLYEAFKKKEKVKSSPVAIQIDDKPRRVQMIVEPISEPGFDNDHVHVLFHELPSSDHQPTVETQVEDSEVVSPPENRQHIELIQQLEEEIDNLREQLHDRAQEHDLAVEELKAINEEQQSNHEELQSTTEELETSKEELQSMNEELISLNEELNNKIKESEQINNDLENFITAINIPIMFLDGELRVKRFSPGIQNFFNIIQTDIGRYLSHLTHDLDYDHLGEIAGKVLKEAVEIEKEIQNLITGAWYLVHFKPYYSVDDNVDGVIITFMEITNRKKAEAEREQLIDELTQNNNDLRQFSYITSHNLRSPISNLTSLLYLTKSIPINNKNLEGILNDIKSTSEVLKETVDDLTNVLVIKSNPSVEQESITLPDIFEQVLEQVQYLIKEHEPHIVSNFDETPSITFNKAYLENIFLNLVTNAFKFRSPDRQLEITVSTRDTGERVLLEFIDNGVGLDLDKNRDRFFGLYQKFHDHSGSKGLGLYIVKSQVEALGGNIEAESEVDKGMTIRIYLNKDNSMRSEQSVKQ